MGGNANGNGKLKKAWNLAEDGMLWKTVLEYTTKEFEKQAENLVAQLQESVRPADALQGLLLDRIAAGYLRKQLMLEAESATREYLKEKKARELSGYDEATKKRILTVTSQPLQAVWSGNVLRYEALIDQALHRDLILLQKLKELAPPAAIATGKLPKNNHGVIEGDTIIS